MTVIMDIESCRLAEQARLDLLKNASERNKWGQFATPSSLALEIAEYAWKRWRRRKEPLRFLDPALGTGSFHSALLQVFPNERISHAVGMELDPEFAKTASALWSGTGLHVVTGDFTKQRFPELDERFNLILTNPPYVRHHHLGPEEKERLSEVVYRVLGIEVSGLAGLYCYFLLICDRWLARDGLAVWLIPSEFMDVNYGAALKRYLTRNVSLLHIHRFCPSDVQFADALVSSAVVVFQQRRPKPSQVVQFSFGGSLLGPQIKDKVPLQLLQETRKWTTFPEAIQQTPKKACPVRRLGDLFTIKRGLATGNNSFFILPRQRAQRLGIPTECLKPILPSPRHLRETIIETDEDGYPILERRLALIDCDYPEEQIRKEFPAFWSYVQSGKKNGIHEGYLASRRSPWYSQEKRPPAPFLCTYMGRSGEKRKPFRFLWNKSKATAANVYLLLYPKPELGRLLESKPDSCTNVFSALQSIDANAFLRESRVYGGGLHKMEPGELSRLSAAPLIEAVKELRVDVQLTFPF